MQQRQRGLEQRVGGEAPLERVVEQQVGQRQQRHALVVRHVRPDDRLRLAARHARGRVVDGLVQPEVTERALDGEPLQVVAGGLRLDHQRERGSVGRDHQLVAEPALQAKPRHAERAVLVVPIGVDHVVAGLGHAPGHAALVAVFDLSPHRGAVRSLEQRVRVRRHDQLRHQVLEHRPAPRDEDRLAASECQHASERKPGVLRQPSLRDREEAAEPRLRGEEVVETRVTAAVADVVADREQPTVLVVEEVEVERRQLRRLARELLDGGDFLVGEAAAGRDRVPQRQQPAAAVVGEARPGERVRHCRQQPCFIARNGPHCRNSRGRQQFLVAGRRRRQ